MFTCAAVRNGSKYLAEHLTANDYYCKEETVLGVWVGQGAEILGIEGQKIGPKDTAFERLRLNKHPETGLPLTPRTKEDRVAFYDFQLSAPKSVSIMAMTAGDSRLIAAHEDCATRAFQTALESVAGRRDHSTDGLKTTGNLVAARFTHHASRELEAQLHCHFVCANATFDAEQNRWYALNNQQMFEAVNLAGRLYQNDFAKAVTDLGYCIAQDRDERGIMRGFEIASAVGYDFTLTKDHLAAQSTRRQQIEAGIEAFKKEKGYAPSAAEKSVIARETRRNKKLSEISTPEVIAHQRAKYSPEEQRHLSAMVKAAEVAPTLYLAPVLEREVIGQALSHCLERSSVTTQKDVLAYALAEYVGQVDYPALLAEVRQQAPILADKGTPLTVITSHENLSAEKEMVKIVAEGHGQFEPLAPGYAPADGLGEDQKAAVRKILEARDSVVALRGPAGTGKTTTLKTLDRAFRESLVEGFKSAQLEPVYVTPRHAAKEVLHEDGFALADTLAATLPRIEKGEFDLRGKILVVDEAGLLSTSEMARTLAVAARAHARVLLVGDEKQLSAVEAGDALAILRRHSPLQVVELTQIRRQEPAGYRAAMQSMAKGKVGEGLVKLDEIGLIKETGPAYLTEAAHAYHERTRQGEAVLLVAPTWAEIHPLNDLVRAERKAAGILSGPSAAVDVFQSAQLTKAQRGNIAQYRAGQALTVTGPVPGFVQGRTYRIESVDTVAGTVKLETGAGGKELAVKKSAAAVDLGSWRTIEVAQGDKIVFQRSDRKRGLSAGKLATVEKIGPAGELTVSFAGKAKHFEVPEGFRSFTHGYAITADKAQGKTTAHVIVAGQSIDAKRLYVATSRGRQTLELHVPSKDRLFATTPATIKNRPAALDYLPPAPPRPSLAQKTTAHDKTQRRDSPALPPLAQDRRKTWVEKAREHYRHFRALAERFLQRQEPEKLTSAGHKKPLHKTHRQKLQEQLTLAQKHAAHQRIRHARDNDQSLGHSL
jgi:conjugative relaxase-like TrwC/TraI family protein